MTQLTNPKAEKGRPGRATRRGQVLEERSKHGRLADRGLVTLGGTREVLCDGSGRQIKFWKWGALRKDWRGKQGLDSEGLHSHAGDFRVIQG